MTRAVAKHDGKPSAFQLHQAPNLMLAQRIATALVMMAVLMAALATRAPWPFAALMLLLVSVAGWEWGRLGGLTGAAAVGLGLLVATTVLALYFAPRWLQLSLDDRGRAWWVVSGLWAVGGVLVLRMGVAGWREVPAVLRLLLGVAMLAAAWFAIAHAVSLGVNFLLSAMAVVWASDIAAYFGGKAMGGKVFGARKLAPSISPGKTWEGAVSGVLGALVLALVWAYLVDPRFSVDGPSLFTRVALAYGAPWMLVAVVVLACAGIVGDLFESLIKRTAGAKDSSQLLPGHGGVLDRIDALLPVLPMAVALVVGF
jgi:phosphatidate cytidylyltransferase